MPSTSETGHAKIPANLFKLITVAKRYPAKYKPANAKLSITAVETLITTCENAVDVAWASLKKYLKLQEVIGNNCLNH